MTKNIFITKKYNNIYLIIIFILFLILLIYFISFYFIINQKYFTISNTEEDTFYIIPIDKEGEKVKFINKKSINNISIIKEIEKKEININNLNYTIQLFSDHNYNNIENYLNNLLNLKSEIISSNDLFTFSINSQIGIDYFVTYKNFTTKNNAIDYCKKLSFVKKCIIINPQN